MCVCFFTLNFFSLSAVGWGSDGAQTFGEPTVKSKIITLINSVRTLLRGR